MRCEEPKEYNATGPGDLVEIDTLDIGPLPSFTWKQFTARDIVSRRDVLEIRSTASARTAKEFLSTIEERMPFPVRQYRLTEALSSMQDLRMPAGKKA